MSPLDIVYITCAENGAYGLKHLHSQGIQINRVVTISKAVAAKFNVSGYTDVTEITQHIKADLITLDTYNLTLEDLGHHQYDLLIVNGWNRLIKTEVINLARLGGIGIHAGHPPIGLGRAPLPWNIIKGFKDIEVYIFKLTERADDGDIIAKKVIEITPFDNVRTLYEKVMFQGAFLFEWAIKQAHHEGRLTGQTQPQESLIYYPKRTSADGHIDFRESVEVIHNFIRAQTDPYPGAYAMLEGDKWNIWEAIPFDSYAFRGGNRIPGQIVAALPSGLVVQTGSAPLWILRATSENRTVVPNSLVNMESYVGKKFATESK